MKIYEAARTDGRVYWIYVYPNGTASVRYQSINKKTGKPWQAIRAMRNGENVWVVFFSDKRTPQIIDKIDDKHPEVDGAIQTGSYYRTEADAVAAVNVAVDSEQAVSQY